MCALMTLASYAKRIGKNHQYVSQLVKDGRLTVTRGKINPKIADKELAANRPGKAPTRGRGKKPAKRGPGRPVKAPKQGETLFDANLRKERARAELEELRVAKQRGELVNRSEIRDAIFILGRSTRDAILRVPARISSILASENNELKIRTILEHELRAALAGLEDIEIDRHCC